MKQPKPIEQAANPNLRGSWPALLRAARRARELAAQTGTAIVVSHDGVIEYIRPQPETPSPHVAEPHAEG
ncbi:hypothetical protein [Immundisolibacter sp.]|jgi:hypothetical protein|uniref:hypothetical protein n=1 Tax=Immundisolibacter sp. TaxID=1934948 RepID=UPI0019A54F88|nr:hypothetical protein [Immundisolibacter sp.]MBC7161461.1 hypothetical protein [Immundisolibacter sp.]MEA3219154.1 hypothetical protein [Immundisolibacter sp.]